MWFSTFLVLNLLRRRAHSALTLAGMAIAVGTAVALLGIADSFERSSVQAFAGRGIDIVIVEQGILDQLTSDLNYEYADPIRHVPGVRGLAPGLIELVDYSHTGTVLSVLLQGWEPDSLLFDELKILDGRVFNVGEKGVTLLGKTLAETLDKHVGDTVVFQRESFRVVGIYESFNIFENGAATLPLGELQRIMGRPRSVTGFSVVLESQPPRSDSVAQVCQRIEALD